MYTCIIPSLLSSVDGHFAYYHVLAIVNSAAMTIGVHVSFMNYSFGLRYISEAYIYIYAWEWDCWII